MSHSAIKQGDFMTYTLNFLKYTNLLSNKTGLRAERKHLKQMLVLVECCCKDNMSCNQILTALQLQLYQGSTSNLKNILLF